MLSLYLCEQHWFPGKTQTTLSTRVTEVICVPTEHDTAYLLMIEVEYADREPDTMLVPLDCAAGERAQHLLDTHPQAVLARLHTERAEQDVYDALLLDTLPQTLLRGIREQTHFNGSDGTLDGSMLAATAPVLEQDAGSTDALQGEHNNAIVLCGQQSVLKIFRSVGEGVNPELELSRFLNAKQFADTPPVLGALEYHSAAGVPMTLAILQGFVPNQGEAWQIAQQALRSFFEQAQHASANEADALDQPDGWHADCWA